MQITGLHHLHRRKHGEIALTPFVKFMDVVALLNGILGSFTALPQIYQIMVTGSATGVSLLTWILLIVSSIIWLIYAIPHRIQPIIIASAISIVLNSGVIVAVLTR